ncbi:MAG: TetR family transcriptional regulator [Gammaproteobacteria bacterium]|nr:TetR family transcriptional regulator [Gammaproteobacteria bacterium]
MAGRKVNLEERLQRKRDILEGATELFIVYGFERTTMQMIADKLKINVALIYYYFPNKQALLFGFLESVLETLLERTRDAISNCEQTPVDRMRAFVRAHILLQSEIFKSSAIYTMRSLVLSGDDNEHYNKRLNDLEHENYSDLIRLIDEGIESGDFEVIDKTVTAFGIFALSEHYNHWFKEGKRLTKEVVADINASLALRMLGVNGA